MYQFKKVNMKTTTTNYSAKKHNLTFASFLKPIFITTCLKLGLKEKTT